MIIINPTSLSATLDATADSLFHQKLLPPNTRDEIATMIISRQCHFGVNSGFFIPFAAESEAKVRLYTGELLNTALARTHILLIEAVRILKLLAFESHALTQSIQLADQRMDTMCYSNFCAKGECKALTIAYLRYLFLDGTGNSSSQINTHLTKLNGQRDGKGKWGSFPFFYTVLALSESVEPLARQELQYALPTCEKQQAQNWLTDPISIRRQEIISKALAMS
jgi:hypothetical protein